MTTIFMEPGTGATYGGHFYDSTVGTVNSDTTSPLPSNSPHVNDCYNAANQANYRRKNGILADAGRRISFYLYEPSEPASGYDSFEVSLRDSGGTVVARYWAYRWVGNNAGYYSFHLSDGVGGTLATGTTNVLRGDQWERIGIAYTITSTTVNQFRLWGNGTLLLTASNVTLPGTGTADLYIGHVTADLYGAYHHRFAHLWVDDSTSLADPGDIRVAAKVPGAVNNNNFDTTVGTGAVNERPLATGNAKRHNAAGQVDQDYTLEAASSGDVNLTGNIIARCAWMYATRTGSGSAGTPALIDQGNYNAVSLVDDTPTLYTVITDTKTYPSAAQGIGMRSTGGGKDSILYECGIVIAFYGTNPAGTLTTAGAIKRIDGIRFGGQL